MLKKIIPKLKNNDTVIIESTVPIGFTEKVSQKIKNLRSDLDKIHVAYVSEKAIPGKTINEMINNDRVIGCDKKSRSKIKFIYKSFVRGNLFFT